LAQAKLANQFPGSDEQLKPGSQLGDEYLKFGLPIVKEQLAQGTFGLDLTSLSLAIYKRDT
jgi:hypothetical protein